MVLMNNYRYFILLNFMLLYFVLIMRDRDNIDIDTNIDIWIQTCSLGLMMKIKAHSSLSRAIDFSTGNSTKLLFPTHYVKIAHIRCLYWI